MQKRTTYSNHFAAGMRKTLTSLIFLSLAIAVQAQFTVKGAVLEAGTGTPLIGVNIYETENPSNGTVTDVDGNFTLNVKDANATLMASYVGYTDALFSLEGKNEVIITMASGVALDEIVVTALGIERDKKALGYAVQEVSGEELNTVRSPNLLNNLSGRLAGVQVTGVNNGVASSSRIVIRGESSLNINNNSPLFVVDGVPVNNNIYGIGGGSIDQANMPTDYGNGASEINPEDIESISVLRGAAASALYGSRAANGVIVITTKSGKARKGLGVQVSSSTMYSDPLVLPEIQNQYGGGWGLEYYADFGTNFGPSLVEGRSILQDGSPGFDNGTEEPFVYRYQLDDFFQTGVNSNNQISITGGGDKGNFRLSYANSYNTGIVPNTNLKRDNFNVNTSYQPSEDWTINVSATYIKSNSDNLPVAGYGGQGLMYALLWNYVNVDLDWLKQYWTVEDREQRNIFTWADNPFLIINEHINAFEKDRLFGNISSMYQITPELSLMLRIGTDYSNDFRWSRRPMGSVYHPNGMYREQGIDFQETNADFLLSYDKRMGDVTTKLSVGGNRLDQKVSESFLEGQSLAIPGIYTLGNINVTPVLSRYNGQKRVNSLYGFANIGYKDFLYLDLTARNDWSSTLPANENAYFYPSLSLSIIPTELVQLGSALDYLKARFNVARVGKDTDPFQLQKTYRFGLLPNSVTNPSQLPNELLKPEQTDSWEVGLEAYFLKRRFFTEITYYNTTSTNQIISFAVSGASGYESVFANAGKIKNSGVELILGVSPVRTADFEWNIMANFTANRSEVLELYGDLESYIIAQGPDGVTVDARPGGRMGDIYGNTYVHAPDGQIVYNTNGLPLLGPRESVGNYNPDWMLGLSSGISYKNLRLYGLFDIRQGGIIYSYTHAIGHESGILVSSLPGREEGIIGEGVVENPDGTYSPNTTLVDAETWYYGGVYPRENAEANSFDASYVKLRELSLAYSLPKKWLNKAGIGNLTLALVGNNLALWTDVPNIDPEAQALNGGTLIPGFEVTQLPSTRSYGFKINLDF
ncbi:MAG TPA: SusC/RagA family TonB-linked outer membrane protein [Saprospiraceae bacterium]|nr:SusC/RagA family TonB-linked outer membrane protein [Saprospiraceae bacterium]HMQ85729.1 SusC/RagA family TonB-linked outer membrane protein [Saprospiraceae bacterium]